MKEIKTMMVMTTALIMLAACGSKKEDGQADVLKVETETVSEQNGSFTTSYVGEVEAETSTAVSFTGAGLVTRVLVSEGQRVSKGQLIATMDPTQARNALAMAQATYTQAQDAYERMKTLHDQKSLSDMDWVEVQSKVAQAKSSVSMAQKAVKDCNLTAPCSGVIGNKKLETGMTALPAEPVCNILYINNVKVKVSIPEKEIATLSSAMLSKDGGIIIAVDALGKKQYKATKMEKGVEADIMTHTYDVRLTVGNANRELLPGMVANVSIPSLSASEREGAVSVPIRSVQQSANGRHFVWTVKNGKSHRTYITTGQTMGNRIAVTSGLNTGDMVIVAGYQKVSEGSEVKK